MGTAHKHRGICWLLSGVLLVASLATADIARMSNGSVRDDLWIESIDIRPDGVRVVANRLAEGRISDRSDRFAGADFATLEFQIPGESSPGRVARVTTPQGVLTHDLVIEFAEWGTDGFTFRCRHPNTAPGDEVFEATSEHARLIEFAPAPFAVRNDVQPITRGIMIPDRSNPVETQGVSVPPETAPETSGASRPIWLVFLAGVAFTLFVVITLIGAGLLAWLMAIRRQR